MSTDNILSYVRTLLHINRGVLHHVETSWGLYVFVSSLDRVYTVINAGQLYHHPRGRALIERRAEWNEILLPRVNGGLGSWCSTLTDVGSNNAFYIYMGRVS